MTTFFLVQSPVFSGRVIADVLTPDVIAVSVSEAVDSFGAQAFALAFTAFGENAIADAKAA